jgi:hypothetical protein
MRSTPLLRAGTRRNVELQDGENIFRIGANAVVCVRLSEENAAGDVAGGIAMGLDDEGGGEGEAPGVVAVDEGDVDEDGTVVEAEGFGDGVGDAEGVGETGAGVGEDGKGEVVVLDGEVILALELWGNGDEQGSTIADGGEGRLPGFELSHAVGTPAATEEVDDEGADGEEIGGADELAVDGVGECKGRGGGADGEEAVFDAGGEEFVNGGVGDGEAVGLDERTGLRGDVVELGLEIGARHLFQCRTNGRRIFAVCGMEGEMHLKFNY